jgi:hypothetical protein
MNAPPGPPLPPQFPCRRRFAFDPLSPNARIPLMSVNNNVERSNRLREIISNVLLWLGGAVMIPFFVAIFVIGEDYAVYQEHALWIWLSLGLAFVCLVLVPIVNPKTLSQQLGELPKDMDRFFERLSKFRR